MNNQTYLSRLTGLRFIAASYTIFFHYWSFPDSIFMNSFVKHGHISVPFFFLLSGFVLSYTYHNYNFNAPKSYLPYLKNRFLRLMPIYYLSLFLSLAIMFIRFKETPLSPIQLFISISSHLTFTQALIPFNKLINSWNIHSWSLSVEALLYILSPLIFRKITDLKLNTLIVILLICTFINSIIFTLSYGPIDLFSKISSFFSPLYIPTFISGAVLAKIYISYADKLKSLAFPFFWASAIILLVLFSTGFSDKFYSSFNPIFHITFSMLILGASFPLKSTSLLGSNTFVFLGNASYAMYILQAPIKLFTQQVLSKILGYTASTGIFYCMVIYLSIILFSVIATKYYEPKIRKIIKR